MGKKAFKDKGPTISNVAPQNELNDQKQNDAAGAKFANLRDKIQSKLQEQGDKKIQRSQVRSNKQGKNEKWSEHPRGKKRTSEGNILAITKNHGAIAAKPATRSKERNEVDDELEKAIKELGGDEEDLALVGGANSDSEMEGVEDEDNNQVGKGRHGTTLKQGLSNILKEIALHNKSSNGNASDSDLPEDDDEQREEENNRDQNSHAEPKKQAKALKIQEPETNSRNPRLQCEPCPDWFIKLPEIDVGKDPKRTPSKKSMEQLYQFAKTLLDSENDAYGALQQSKPSQSFYNTVIASGTLTDKVSALTLAVQESPVHAKKALETLIGLAGKRSRGQAIDVLRAIKDLFAQGSLLPSNRRLYTFYNQPALEEILSEVKTWNLGDALPLGCDKATLIRWAFEDWLKEQYFEILKILEIWCNDEIEFTKSRAISYIYELLKEKPEQESNLLRLLINKLGDPVRKIASQASYLLMQLLINHPAMKMVVISAIESEFIFRPGQAIHGKYYAVTTLNQTVLSVQEEVTANKLLDIYFDLFVSLLRTEPVPDAPSQPVAASRAQRQRKSSKKHQTGENQQKEELREKLISAILTGINRAYPYAPSDRKNFQKHLDTLFQITHSANFNTGIQAMMLIQQLSATHGAAADRFYRTLYESLLDARLITASKQQLYLNLLHRALKADLNTKRLKAFVKRLLQVLSLHDPAFICGSFFLLKDLEKDFPSLGTLLSQPEQDEDEEEVFHDVIEDEPPSLGVGKSKIVETTARIYDSSKRAPEHANADSSCAWEVLPYLAHFHPSVSVTTERYLSQSRLPGNADLSLHTLIHFLDRFVYRNPKLSSSKMRGSSIMQPMANDDTNAVLIGSNLSQDRPAVNTSEFRNLKNTDIDAEDVFFHKYFTTLGKDVKVKKVKKARDADEQGSVGDEGEDEIWKAMIESAPDLENEDSDEDLDLSSLEDMTADEEEEANLNEGVIGLDSDDSMIDVETGILDDSNDDHEDDETSNDEHSVTFDKFGASTPTSDDGSDFAVFDTAEEPRTENKEVKGKRANHKKIKNLPVFASATDYARMLEDDADEDLGYVRG